MKCALYSAILAALCVAVFSGSQQPASAGGVNATMVQELPMNDGQGAYPIGIDNSGRVAGVIYNQRQAQGFVWSPLANSLVSDSRVCPVAIGVGMVVGFGNSGVGGNAAYIWTDLAGTTRLPDELGLDFAGLSSNGVMATGNSSGKPVLYTRGKIWPLDLPVGTYPCSVNNAGSIAGIYTVNRVGHVFFRSEDGLFTDLTPKSIDSYWVAKIGNQESIVGSVFLNNLKLMAPFAYNWGGKKGVQILHCLSGKGGALANDVNDLGIIVGTALKPNGVPAAAAWSPFTVGIGGSTSTTAIDLNTLLPKDSGWYLSSAVGVNSKGDVTGVGMHNGRQTTYLFHGACQALMGDGGRD